MKRAFAAAALTAGLILLFTLAGRAAPDVWRDLNGLPNRGFIEMVETKTPQTIEVTVARVPLAAAPPIDRWNPQKNGEVLDPRATIVSRFASAPGLQEPLRHRIALPPLAGGIYEVLLSSPERTAVQYLSVSTISTLLNRSRTVATIMAFDVHTLRDRSDVTATVFGASGARTVRPSPDGLLRFPNAWLPKAGETNYGLVVVASDGSVVALEPRRNNAPGPFYMQTDRKLYRAGDRVSYRLISAEPTITLRTRFGLLVTTNHIAEGSFVIPPATPPGSYLSDNLTVSDAPAQPYRVDIAPLQSRISAGPATFVISALRADGEPAAGLRLDYDSNTVERHAVVLDASGNAVIRMPSPHGSDLRAEVYWPGSRSSVADSWVQVRNPRTLMLFAPETALPDTCYASGIEERNGSSEVPGRAIRFTVSPLHRVTLEPPPPLLEREVSTGADGFALVRWCSGPVDRPLLLMATDRSAGLEATVPLYVANGENPEIENIFTFPSYQKIERGAPFLVTAVSPRDGDALVAYNVNAGAGSSVVHFVNDVGHSVLPGDGRGDYVSAVFDAPAPQGEVKGFVNAALSPQRYRLSVAVDCLHGMRRTCVRVSDWRGRGERARVFVDVAQTTLAGLLDLPDQPAYTMLHSFDQASAFSSPWRGGVETPPTSYLYPASDPPSPQATTPRTPGATAIVDAAVSSGAWAKGVTTDRDGYAEVPLNGAFVRGGLYIVHVLAVGSNGDVGEAYAWLTR